MNGYVYILTNEAMPGLIKIGRTCRSVEIRAEELWQTGVPVPFSIFTKVGAIDCVELERDLHQALWKRRLVKSREFFRCDPDYAEGLLRQLMQVQIEQWLSNMDTGLCAITLAEYMAMRAEGCAA